MKGFVPFIWHHAREIKEGGWPILLRKIRTLLKLLWLMLQPIMLLPLYPVVLIVRALRPFVLIRFGSLWSDRIGHLGVNTELYLCCRDAGMDNQRAFDVFYHSAPACNQQLKRMWERTLHVSCLARPIDIINRTLPSGKNHIIPSLYGDRDVDGLMQHTPIHLSFTPEEEQLGLEGLQSMGIPEGTPFICFHSRDSAYLESKITYTHFRQHDHRDSSIHNHVPAAEEMARRGYFAIRIGAIVKKPIQTTNPMIIDYATKYRSDFMDIFLCAKCYFYFGDQGGLCMIPAIFRKPVATVNVVPIQLAQTWGPDDLFILKKLWLREERRFLTFREIFDRQIDFITKTERYEQLGIEVVENTPEEITATVVEMDERLKGTWQTTEEYEDLQQRFRFIFKPMKGPHGLLHGVIASRIGTEFLRQNQELLD